MAEAILSIFTEAIVSHAIHRISYLLRHEETSLTSVKTDVEYLRNELLRIQCFLKTVYIEQEQDDRVRNWVSEISNVACEIEDVVEIYIVKVDSSFFKAFHLKKLRKQVNSIKAKIESIFESKKNYGIEFVRRDSAARASTPAAVDLRQRSLRRSFPEEEEDDIISLDHSMTILKTRLILEDKDDQLCVVSIVGMAGLGKTTLAKKVYNDDDVKKHFDCRAWVFVSHQYVSRDIFSEILMQVGFPQCQYPSHDGELETRLEERRRIKEILNSLGEDDLTDYIKDRLKGKRYLIVVDDIWRNEDWDIIKRVFPRGEKGSKVVFTTRIKQVASYADPNNFTIEPPFLTLEESWLLLQRKSLARHVSIGGSSGVCTPISSQFEHMGKKMAMKCGGLPLAIVKLGGLLRTKKLYDEWQKVEKEVNLHLNRYGVKDTLASSYHDLPYYLKPCFLYLSSFPKDFEIPKSKLIQLWIAEGLVTGSETKRWTMEEIAEQYFRELIDRCMIQVVKWDYTGVGVKTCRVHCLMRDFCVSKAREDKFSEVIQHHDHEKNIISTASSSSTSSSSDPHPTSSRRVVIHIPGCDLDRKQMHQTLRSLTCFHVSPLSFLKLIRSKNFKLLRVLEFGFRKDTAITRNDYVPVEIGDLIHLRYLGLRDGGKVILPSSIGNLRNLGTINLRDNYEVVLPVEILKLSCLKHMLLPFGTCFSDDTFSWGTYVLSDPKKIQTLKYIKFGPLLLKNKITISELTNLRNLGVEFKTNEEVRLFLAFPNFKLSMLKSLNMSLHTISGGFSNLQQLSKCVALSKLFLDGKILDDLSLEILPESLTKLILKDSGLSTDPMPVLEKLPNLRYLRLHNSYNGSRMVCGGEGFPRLETLQLISLRNVMVWRVEPETTMPNLQRLYVRDMPELSMIPEELCVKNLSELKVSEIGGAHS
ncbi:protein RECOGNITION OF PERONOSPORA PARASITICA 7-like [Humulus lupulus]|uniref:protein RECOGNITION OF PERONOSPORA PARASITICA 7-like n=1 Tax=Humulus lupulus TaxID=3486 RepID=UPI002B40A09B|nr:protein RECOGNITION OF PERONOSPORA PARASITICA 7-like [Humulus lupulus]